MELIYTPTDFVAIANQTLDITFGLAYIEGELANFRISKNKWVYFDLKDDNAKVSCFASIYALPGPLEDGMVVKVAGSPRLHPQFGFSVTVQAMQPSGEGSLKKAFDLLKAKLEAEGLFDESRKRTLPYPPKRIALVTSLESAAYADFIKVASARWPFLRIDAYDTQVQGESAPAQLVMAISAANSDSELADVLVMTRGGGSADDLAAFNDERVVRAIAASRIPTLVAIGHEIDESLAELCADVRASTPSNAAELLVPDVTYERQSMQHTKGRLAQVVKSRIAIELQQTQQDRARLVHQVKQVLHIQQESLVMARHIVNAYNPNIVLERGYALVRKEASFVKGLADVKPGDTIEVELARAHITAKVTEVKER
ncbi:MAG: exodeoxyribonuclease VII large subunit [Candidatus Saccharimonadales bacterium]